MTNTSGHREFGATPFSQAPHARLSLGSGGSLAWAIGGNPTALDAAAAAILDCYEDAPTPEELVEDLQAVFELDEDVARRSIINTTYALQMSGLILAAGVQPQPRRRFNYPPAGSF